MERESCDNGVFSSKITKLNRKSQVTIFVIIAIILVVGIAGYFLVTNYFFTTIPKEVQPVYDYYSSCLSNVLGDGASIMASQAGYLYYESFEPGSEYAPFSSVLDFSGMGIPYWYYVSANGVKKEQMPTKSQMQQQLAKYLTEELSGNLQLNKCDLSSFKEQGFIINFEDVSSSKVTISDNGISASLSKPMIVSYNGQTYTLKSFNLESNSQLGTLYNQARSIYDYEMKNSFLENYSVDVLYNYAPVSGTKLDCSPAIWQPTNVFSDLKNALNANIGSLKVNGNYYSGANSYFVVGRAGELNVGNNIATFLYSGDWPARFEVWPTKNGLMKAEAVGTQPGLSAMGFCYAPYKFVYDMYFPVLIQITTSNGAETFQFPVSVIVSKNVARESIDADYINTGTNICDNANSDLTVNVYNINLEPVEADIEFKCLTDTCDLGKATAADNITSSLNVKVPQCVNGILIVNAEGYKEKRYTISTNEENSADIVLDRDYGVAVEVYVDGKLTTDNSVLIINSVEGNTSRFVDSYSYPQGSSLKLSEGNYKFDLKVYTSNIINIPASTSRQCSNVAKTGALGLLGFTEEKCVDINIPSQQVTSIPIAGGYVYAYLTPDILTNARVLRVYATSIKTPTNAQEISDSFENVAIKKIDMEIA